MPSYCDLFCWCCDETKDWTNNQQSRFQSKLVNLTLLNFCLITEVVLFWWFCFAIDFHQSCLKNIFTRSKVFETKWLGVTPKGHELLHFWAFRPLMKNLLIVPKWRNFNSTTLQKRIITLMEEAKQKSEAESGWKNLFVIFLSKLWRFLIYNEFNVKIRWHFFGWIAPQLKSCSLTSVSKKAKLVRVKTFNLKTQIIFW